jgi:ATP-dependent RNA helicase RhlE
MSNMYGGRRRSFGSSGGSRSRQPYRQSRSFGTFIAPSRYVQAAQLPEEEVVFTPTHTFSDFGFEAKVRENVERHGYTTPTPIQDQAIPALMSGRDVVGIANTGTGKTAAFLLPLINKVLLDPKQGVLILAPTRELALQIVDEFKAFAAGLPISSCLCIGGMNIVAQVQRLRDNPHFVIGTPGRIKDLIQRNAFDTAMFTNIVLDEVDRMLDIGFRHDIMFLISQLPLKRHAAFFSATLNKETDVIARTLLTDPVTIQVSKKETNQHIEQDVIKLQVGQNKIDVLHELLLKEEFKKVMVFGRTKHGINKLEEILAKRGVRVTSIHGNKNQNARQRSLDRFKAGHVQALLATDVAARGIDIEDVTHVINYDEPQSYDDYVHRIGRTGRAGKMGKALTFVV